MGPVLQSRDLLEANDDLGRTHGKRLPGAYEDRHAGPAPAVDPEPDRDERLRVRSGLDSLDLPVALVLPSYDVCRIERRHRTEHVEAVPRDGTVVSAGRLHHHEREHLQEVVLNDVSKRADAVVERTPTVDAEVLRHRDLDRV